MSGTQSSLLSTEQLQDPARPAGLRRAEFIALLAFLMAVNALAIDVVLPAYPELAAAFGLNNDAEASQVLVTYILGFGIGQLAFGPISDRYGRRQPLTWGLVLYAVAAFTAMLAPSFAMLLVLRFLQGIGAAASRTIAVAVVRDTMKGRAMASLMSLVSMVFMVVPIFAPMMGEALLMVGDWRGMFLAMALLSVAILVWFLVRLPETLSESARRPLTAQSVIGAFQIIVANRTALFYAISTGLIYSALFGFLTLAQPVFVGVYGLEKTFTLAFGALAAMMGVASLVNSALVERLGSRRLCHGAMVAFLGLTSLLFLVSLGGNPPLWLFTVMIGMILGLFGLIGANMNAIAMEPLGEVAGSASSVLGFMQSIIAGILGAMLGLLFSGQIATFAAGLVAAAVSALLAVGYAEHWKLFSAPNAGGA